MLVWISGSTSESASAAASLAIVSKMASRSSGLSSSTMSARSAGCRFSQSLVGDVQAQAPLRIGFDDVAEFPTDGTRGMITWAFRIHAVAAPPGTDAGRCSGRRCPTSDTHSTSWPFFLPDLEGDVGAPDHFTSLCVDHLLIEKVAHHAQHVFVAVVRGEVLVAQVDASREMEAT
jgi:hypothetical protein